MVDTANLIKLASFTDIHLSVKAPEKSVLFLSGVRKPVPSDLVPLIQHLSEQVTKAAGAAPDGKSFMVDMEPVRYRAQAIREGDLYALRQSRIQAPELGKDVCLPEHINRELLSEGLRSTGGLVVINGIPGSGKTTTAQATLLKRLELHGGYCLTIEDPIEVVVEGWVGDKGGYCEQMDATKEGYRKAVATSLRCFPAGERAMLFIGEIREPEPAAEMLRIALGGHLVFTTVHAESHAAACQRIIALAQDGGEPDAKLLLASSLRMSINQRLDGNRMQASILKVTDQIRGNIERGEYSQFKNEAAQQNRAMQLSSAGPAKTPLAPAYAPAPK